MQLLYRINRTGTTVVMATHDREMVDKMRRRVIPLEDGRGARRPARGLPGMRWRFFVVEALRSLRQNLATTLAACVTVLIVTFLLGVFAVVFMFVRDKTQDVRDDVTVTVYVKKGSETQAGKLDRVRNQLVAIPNVKSITYVSPEVPFSSSRRRSASRSECWGTTRCRPALTSR